MAPRKGTIPKTARKTARTAHKRAARRAAEYRKACRRVVRIDPYHDCMLIVDATGTFFPKGPGAELPVPGGEGILQPILRSAEFFYRPRPVVTETEAEAAIAVTIEEHKPGHVSYETSYLTTKKGDLLTYETVRGWKTGLSSKAAFTLRELKRALKKGGPQPIFAEHSIAGSEGAKLHPVLRSLPILIRVYKGQEPIPECFGGFHDACGTYTPLVDKLDKYGFERLIIFGLAEDYCVGETALQAKKLGYQVYVVRDGTRAVTKAGQRAMRKKFREAGIPLIHSRQLRRAKQAA